MSEYGKSEFARWWAEAIRRFPAVRPVYVTDDLVAFATVGGFNATAQYQGILTPSSVQTLGIDPKWIGSAYFKITPEFIPGRALVYHELAHHIQRLTEDRLGAMFPGADVQLLLVTATFDLRGAPMPNDRNLAREIAASMLPECLIGEWGGYHHPLLGDEPFARDMAVRIYASTPIAQTVREFLLGYETWTPGAAVVEMFRPHITLPGGGAPTTVPSAPTTASLPELAYVYYSQWDPDHVGTGDCVPTCAKMLVEFYTGRVSSIAILRDDMDLAPDGIRNLARDAGIALEAARAVLTVTHGIPCTAVLARDLDVEQLLELVRVGRFPIVFELHGDLPTRMDQPFRGLHAVWLVGIEGTSVVVKDPDRWGPNKADRWLVAIDDFKRAYNDGAVLGGGAIIPSEPRKGWDDDMSYTDEDRRRDTLIYEALYPGDDGQSIFGTITAGFNVTLPTIARRIIRSILAPAGQRRDPFGDARTSPPSPWNDDNSPIV